MRVGGYKDNKITASVSFFEEKRCEFQPYFREAFETIMDTV